MNSVLSLFSHLSKGINIYFVRHAQSQYNKENIIAGRIETPLTDEGIIQAKVTGEHFSKTIPLDSIIHSPIGRAKHTAEIICNAYGENKPLFIECGELIEISAGVLENKRIIDVKGENKKLFESFKQRSWEAIPRAERITKLRKRTRKIWRMLYELAKKGYEHVAVVSHGGFMQWIFKTSFGIKGEHVNAWSPIVKISNCGVFYFKIEPSPNTGEQSQSSFATWQYINTIYY